MNFNYGTIGFLGVIIMGSLMLSQLGMTEGMDVATPASDADDAEKEKAKAKDVSSN